MITDIKEKYTNINIEREPEEDYIGNDILVELSYYPSYIPEGYKQSNIENYGNLELIYFENDNGDIIEFLQSEQDPDFQVDTEGANTTEININGAEGILVSKEGVNTLFWFTDTNNFYITGKLDQEEIITMAESLEYIK